MQRVGLEWLYRLTHGLPDP
ncbi:hypothetical protein, partial [Mycobacterium kubicae]